MKMRAVAIPLAVLLSGCTAGQFTDDLFEPVEIATGPATHQTVLTGFLLGGDVADLAVVSVDEYDDRRVRIYAFSDGTWRPALDATLRPEVLFVDVADIGGHDRLLIYEPGRLSWFDPESGTQAPLVTVTSAFDPPPRDLILHVDFTRDVNADDRDDLVVPVVDGFLVYIQMDGGAFADPVRIGVASDVGRIYGADGYRYDPWASGRVHEMDYDRDGRSDLVFWNEDHFEVHLQDEHGLFAPAAVTFPTDVAFDSDELAALAVPQEVRRRRMDQELTGDLTGRVLHALTDMNGDGVADLVVFSLEGGSLLNMHSTYEVHFGAPGPDGGTVFSPDVGTAIHSDGITFGMDRHDFDGDGQVDMAFTLIDPGIFNIVGMLIDAMLIHSVAMDLELYRMADGVYSNRPNATRKIRADTPGASEDRSFFPSVLIGDVNGDGREDLLVGRRRKELCVYLGVPGPGLFARRPQRIAVTMPEDEEYTWLVDLDEDGKQDVLMHHPSTTEPHRVTMLIAR